MTDRVVMVGAFPPPVGGAAKNNGILFGSLIDAGVDAVKLDTSASTIFHRRTARFHAERINHNARALLRARRLGGEGSVIYFVPNAGAGAWYTLAQVKAAGRAYGRLVLHHRSFRYIDAYSRPIALLNAAFPAKTTHVFLSSGMAHAFQARYGKVTNVIASNARFVSDEAATEPTPRISGPLLIGYLSNLCAEKGFFDVADSYDAVRKAGIDAKLWLAGPVIEPEVQVRLEELRRVHRGGVEYHGPLSGFDKGNFYRRLDVFLFPTRFEQEAAPNVVYESLAAGVPVLAFKRGCIPEMVSGAGGAICARRESFPKFVVGYLESFPVDDDASLERARAVKASILEESRRSQQQYEALMQLLGARTANVRQEF